MQVVGDMILSETAASNHARRKPAIIKASEQVPPRSARKDCRVLNVILGAGLARAMAQNDMSMPPPVIIATFGGGRLAFVDPDARPEENAFAGCGESHGA
jgi:hypothetical protein